MAGIDTEERLPSTRVLSWVPGLLAAVGVGVLLGLIAWAVIQRGAPAQREEIGQMEIVEGEAPMHSEVLDLAMQNVEDPIYVPPEPEPEPVQVTTRPEGEGELLKLPDMDPREMERELREAERLAVIDEKKDALFAAALVSETASHLGVTRRTDTRDEGELSLERMRETVAGYTQRLQEARTAAGDVEGGAVQVGETESRQLPQRSGDSRQILRAGAVIPAVLLTGIDSQLPGQVIAQVGAPVYDSASGRTTLIPFGARLIGEYKSGTVLGQQRLAVDWQIVQTPEGEPMALNAMPAVDRGGQPGLHDRVETHWWRTFGSATLLGLVSAGFQQGSADTNVQSTSGQEQAAEGISEEWSELAKQVIERQLGLGPTITIRPGYVFHVMVTRDLVFPEGKPHA